MTGRAELHTWLPGPLDRDMERAVERLLRTEGIAHVALMPDAHLAEDVCVGTVLASEDRVFPDAVGGDIGCGMRALALDVQRTRSIDRPRPTSSTGSTPASPSSSTRAGPNARSHPRRLRSESARSERGASSSAPSGAATTSSSSSAMRAAGSG